MGTDGATIAIGAIVLVLLAMPFIFDGIRRASKRKQLIIALRELARENHCVVHRYELVGDMALGLDEARGTLFLLDQRDEEARTQVVELAHVQNCRVEKTGKRGRGSVAAPPDRIELCLHFHGGRLPDQRLVLHDGSDGTPMNGQIAVADLWSQHINSLLIGRR